MNNDEFVSIGPGAVVARSVLVPSDVRLQISVKAPQSRPESSLRPEPMELDLFEDI